MSDRTVILDPSVTAERFKAGADEIGWTLLNEYEAGKDTTYELVYRATADGNNQVNYVEDQFLRVRYALARGSDADEVAADIAQLFPHFDSEDVLAWAEEEDELQVMVNWLLSATVLGEQAGHERMRKLVEKRLAHENSAVRRTALISASWLEWPDFRKTVEKMAKEDPAKDVREDAGNLAESYRLRDKGAL